MEKGDRLPDWFDPGQYGFFADDYFKIPIIKNNVKGALT